MNTLEVKTRKPQFLVIAFLGIFFISIGLILLSNAFSDSSAVVSLAIGLLCLIFYAVVLSVFIASHRKSIRNFTSEYATRNDGRKLSLKELTGVINRTAHNPRTNRLVLRRCEILFKNGESAWLIPARISNFQEVFDYVQSLPCEHLEK